MNDDKFIPESPSDQRRILEIASSILRGELGIIAGSRLLCGLRTSLPSLDSDPDFLLFIAIDSETDHLPVGDTRKYWAADALAKKDQEIQASEVFYRDHVFPLCERLITRFNAAPTDSTRDA